MEHAPTLSQINLTNRAHFQAVNPGKLNLACAVRDCCQHLPVGTTLHAAGHRLKWVEGECTLTGEREFAHSCIHTKNILLLDGAVLDEPEIVQDERDWSNSAYYVECSGPADGWYVAGARQKYNAAAEAGSIHPDLIDDLKPCAYPSCSLAALQEVAQAMPEALSTWQSRQMAEATEQTAATTALVNELRGIFVE